MLGYPIPRKKIPIPGYWNPMGFSTQTLGSPSRDFRKYPGISWDIPKSQKIPNLQKNFFSPSKKIEQPFWNISLKKVKIRNKWSASQLGKSEPHGGLPTWESGSDGKMSSHGKNEPRWEETDQDWKKNPDGKKWTQIRKKWTQIGKNKPRWEKGTQIGKFNPDGKEYLPAVRILSEMRICELPQAKWEPVKEKLVYTFTSSGARA